jgi:hypothetical protein
VTLSLPSMITMNPLKYISSTASQQVFKDWLSSRTFVRTNDGVIEWRPRLIRTSAIFLSHFALSYLLTTTIPTYATQQSAQCVRSASLQPDEVEVNKRGRSFPHSLPRPAAYLSVALRQNYCRNVYFATTHIPGHRTNNFMLDA